MVKVGFLCRWVLSFMWLKFTVIWRFFRLAALAAGIDAPENICRCFANNYDIEVDLLRDVLHSAEISVCRVMNLSKFGW